MGQAWGLRRTVELACGTQLNVSADELNGGDPRLMQASLERRAVVIRVLLAAAIGVAVDGAYLYLASGYGPDGQMAREVFVAAFVLLMAGVGLAGAVAVLVGHGPTGPLLWASSAGFLGIGLVGIASIGLPLLAAAGLTFWSALRWPATRITIAAAAVPLVLLTVGFALT
jgi:hypothetical protein